jgi:glutathione synthase/RimK-type ligase-like ATP-grasp enzyme
VTRVAVLRLARLPSFVTWEVPDPDVAWAEDRLVIDAFIAAGIAAESVVWSDPGVDWNDFDAAVLRSTFDYLDAREHFLEVLAAIERSRCRLFNPLEVVRWNIDKRYLLELEGRGVPIVPTRLALSTPSAELATWLRGIGATEAILKPVVGLGGSGARRVLLDEFASTVTELRRVAPDAEHLCQPFLPGVVEEGEWSYVVLGGRLSHVLLKTPAAGDYRVQGIYGGAIRCAEPSADDVRQVEDILSRLGFDVPYLRLDLVRHAGRLRVMEVELIEPILSFDLVPGALPRFVQAIRDRGIPGGGGRTFRS